MYKRTHELQYKNIEPRILVEPLMCSSKNDSLDDYKVYCFHGEPEFVLIDRGRFQKHQRRAYSLKGEPLDFSVNVYPFIDADWKVPQNYQQIINVARKLSAPFQFVCVNLYSIKGRVFFGELTFTPDNGFNNFTDSVLNRFYGEKF